MYDHDYYATLDQAMVKLLKHTALNGLRTLNAIAMYGVHAADSTVRVHRGLHPDGA